MDMLTLEVLAAQHPRKPITYTGASFVHAACYLKYVRTGDATPFWLEGASEVTYGFATGKQCFRCRGFFEE